MYQELSHLNLHTKIFKNNLKKQMIFYIIKSLIKMDCLSRLTVSKIIRVTTVIYDYTIHREIIYTQKENNLFRTPII